MRPDSAWSEASKKATEKERKGYIRTKAKDIFIGAPGNLVAHTFGEDTLKDKEVLALLSQAVGKYTLDEITSKDGWLVSAETEAEANLREKREAEALAKREADELARTQAELDARTATYNKAWGEWS